MKRKTLVLLLITGLCVATASAQFGVGIVYDPTNYSNALLRYYQLQQHLLQLRASYAQLVAQYNFAVRMAKNIQNMPARYRAQFSQWRNVSALNTYGNTGTWVNGINSGQLGFASTGYQQATTQLLPYNQAQLSGMNADELARVRSQYATVDLADGANTNAIATIGASRTIPISTLKLRSSTRSMPPACLRSARSRTRTSSSLRFLKNRPSSRSSSARPPPTPSMPTSSARRASPQIWPR